MRRVLTFLSATALAAAAFAAGILIRDYQQLRAERQLSEQAREDLDRIWRAVRSRRLARVAMEEQLTQAQRDALALLEENKGLKLRQLELDRENQKARLDLQTRINRELHLLVDLRGNEVFLKRGPEVVGTYRCSAGRGGRLVDPKTGRTWEFLTPRGVFTIRGKEEHPVWVKPDWAFIEEQLPIPPPEDPSRVDREALGAYAMNLGWGYKIHGTQNVEALGRPVSHGCIRLGAEDLEQVFQQVRVGTRVYVY